VGRETEELWNAAARTRQFADARLKVGHAAIEQRVRRSAPPHKDYVSKAVAGEKISRGTQKETVKNSSKVLYLLPEKLEYK
jgi:hypothetical protein